MDSINKSQNKYNKQSRQKVIVKQQTIKTIYNLLLNAVGFTIIITAVVLFTDSKGYFNPDYSNDHTRRKWNAYYKFTKVQPVDVILVGNSHLYTGINPENLSNALGANCFILASPGTTLTDAYFCLKEAITVCKPKIAVVETFSMNGYDSYKLKDGSLSDQFKSFSARKNIGQKLAATPLLFKSDNYLPAWSNTIRNHNFIFNDTVQINKNIKLIKKPEPEKPGLYLGRYIRFTSGIEDSTLLKYNRPGFKAYDYSKHAPSDEAKEYLQKTIKLCKDNNIKLVFLTLPMYYRHAYNYDAYKKDLLSTINDSQQKWLDLQLPYDTAAFTPACFENTVGENQHMTYYGSLVATYKLANYIEANLAGTLPDRYQNISWKRLFYASDGYFENYPPEKDGVSQVLLKNVEIPTCIHINEISFVPYDGAKKLIVKIDKKNSSLLYGKYVRVLALSVVNGQKVMVEILTKCLFAYDPWKHYVFSSERLNPALDIQSIANISLL